jgi:hypothetical protein
VLNFEYRNEKERLKHTQQVKVLDKGWQTRYILKRCISGKKEAMRGMEAARVTINITIGRKV